MKHGGNVSVSKKAMVLSALVFLSLALGACAKKGKIDGSNGLAAQSNQTEVSSRTLTYRFVVNGCDTGYHAFTNSDPDVALRQFCVGLSDGRLNHYCATEKRAQAYVYKGCLRFE